jgi:hypothetical protein
MGVSRVTTPSSTSFITRYAKKGFVREAASKMVSEVTGASLPAFASLSRSSGRASAANATPLQARASNRI